jgi:hypothetical protein
MPGALITTGIPEIYASVKNDLMKSLFVFFFLLYSAAAFAQTESQNKSVTTVPSPAPLYVLKADDKVAEIDPEKNKEFSVNSLKPDWIESVDVLTGDKARAEFGEKGRNGVIIIQFKSYYILSKEVHLLFEKGRP